MLLPSSSFLFIYLFFLSFNDFATTVSFLFPCWFANSSMHYDLSFLPFFFLSCHHYLTNDGYHYYFLSVLDGYQSLLFFAWESEKSIALTLFSAKAESLCTAALSLNGLLSLSAHCTTSCTPFVLLTVLPHHHFLPFRIVPIIKISPIYLFI